MPPSLKRFLYPVADAALSVYGKVRAREYDPKSTIIVSSSGRGGSTWLAEIVASLPKRIMLWEPLHLKNNPDCMNHGFTWQNYVRPGEGAAEKRSYLARLFRGQELSTRTLTSLHLRAAHFAKHQGYVVKFVNANMMLYWMLQQFPLRTVLMVRHPCAVVASQLSHGAWKELTKEQCTIPSSLIEDYPHFGDVFARISEPEEVLAFEWAIQTYVPLSHPEPHPWFITTYEALVERGREEVDRLFAYLDEEVPAAAYARLGVASATTAKKSNIARGKNPLTGWRERLTAKQVDNVLSVCRGMGIDYYSDELLPDYARLPGYARSPFHLASS